MYGLVRPNLRCSYVPNSEREISQLSGQYVTVQIPKTFDDLNNLLPPKAVLWKLKLSKN